MEENIIEVVTDVDFDKRHVVKTKYRIVVVMEAVPATKPGSAGIRNRVKVEAVGTDTSHKGGNPG